jgi:hypothetical protein
MSLYVCHSSHAEHLAGKKSRYLFSYAFPGARTLKVWLAQHKHELKQKSDGYQSISRNQNSYARELGENTRKCHRRHTDIAADMPPSACKALTITFA